MLIEIGSFEEPSSFLSIRSRKAKILTAGIY
jgi:hypothetical protein